MENKDLQSKVEKAVEVAEKYGGFLPYETLQNLFPGLSGKTLAYVADILEDRDIQVDGLPEEDYDILADIQNEELERKGKKSEVESAERQYLTAILNIPMLTPDEELDLATRMKNGDVESKSKLVESHLRMVPPYAKKYCIYGVPYLDLIQEGNLGLLHAAQKYDVDKNVRFSVYARFWIRRYVSRAATEQSGVIKKTDRDSEMLRKIKNMQRLLRSDLGREATLEELSAVLGEKPKHIQEILMIHEQVISLQTVTQESSNNNKFAAKKTLQDQMADDQETVEEIAERNDTYRIVEELVDSKLTEQESRIVRDYYINQITLREIGVREGLTAASVYAVVKKAVNKLSRTRAVFNLKKE